MTLRVQAVFAFPDIHSYREYKGQDTTKRNIELWISHKGQHETTLHFRPSEGLVTSILAGEAYKAYYRLPRHETLGQPISFPVPVTIAEIWAPAVGKTLKEQLDRLSIP